MINAYAYIFGELGYNIHARKFFQALNRITPVCLVPLDPPFGGAYPVETDLATTMIERQKEISLSDPAICLNYASQFHKFNGSHLIGYTVFEYTKLAEDWINLLRQMDNVWTTSQWGKGVLVDNGIQEEVIGVVPEGVDPSIYFPGNREKKDETFRFLSIGKWEPRKGQVELLRAMSEVFGAHKNVELIVSWTNPFNPKFSLKEEIKKLGLTKLPAIKVVETLPTAYHMAQLYNMADCFVLPTKGEGWGLPVMEAMACGLPVITTNYSAITEYANNSNAYLINTSGFDDVYDPQFFPKAGEVGVWARIDTNHLKELLLHVYTHQTEGAELGLRASHEVRTQWTWDDAAKKACRVMEEIGITV